MSRDYTADVAKVVWEGPHDANGYQSMLTTTGKVIEELDAAIADLARQRDTIRNLYAQIRYQAGVFYPESVKDAPPWFAVGPINHETQVRNEILALVENANTANVEVIKKDLLDRSGRQNLPWRNPNAVIATVLSRNGWEKIGMGQYRRKDAA